ncbi:MAG TPA: hypothetical protein VJT15_17420 [Pyrinomonadaceae bacterium]|nr:hypothetical protein [Pyrinomonadaceae bacterium]
MNIPTKTLLLALILVLVPSSAFAQQVIPTNGEVTPGSAPVTTASAAEQLRLLEARKSLLEQQLASFAPASTDFSIMADWIRELSRQIDELKANRTMTSSTAARAALPASSADTVRSNADSGALEPRKPVFRLSRPAGGATNEDPTLQLAWTEDRQENKTYTLTKFIVEIAVSDDREANKRFSRPVFVKEVAPAGVAGQAISVPKEILRSGQKYHWQVLAEFTPNGSAVPELKEALNAPESFKTLAQTFDFFERRGLALQRTVSGDGATEGAQFGFLRTFEKQTVYTADFALIYNKRFKPTQRSAFAFQASVQGSLTSDESESEDAVQFRAGAIIDRNLKRDTINHLYISLAAKYEADQEFRVGKLISENMLTPTIPALGIGIPFGRPSGPVQFRWRPYFYFDVGHSFKNGFSAETQNTVLRLAPRVRTTLSLNFLRRAMNLNETFIFTDDFFYFLPLEKTKNRHNMFTSGFVFQVTKDFGFGLTYKSGTAAPKFRPVHSFGGVLTIRFGGEE